MNKIFMYARPCSIKWRVQWRVQFHYSCKMSVEFMCKFLCLRFGYVKIILNNLNSSSSLWLLPGKDAYFNVGILTLFVFIFIEYLYCVWLRFHYNFNNKLNHKNYNFLDCDWSKKTPVFPLILTKFSIVIGSPRVYLSRNRCAIAWVSDLNFL